MITDTIQTEQNPDQNERMFVIACKKWHVELLKAKEQIVPPCVMYERS